MIAACTTTPEREPVNATGPFTEVYYGTDRNRLEDDDTTQVYGYARGSRTYGIARVPDAVAGNGAASVETTQLTREAYFRSLREAINQADTPSLLVFIHGYNRSFEQVGKQVGEFAHASGFSGVPVMWSWPSSFNPAAYLTDETNLRWSSPHIARFLRDMIEHSGADTVHLVAHSLGARAMTDVLLQDLLPEGIDQARIGEVVLLAPDIDTAIFINRTGPALVAAGLDVTLYTSANDKAMATARVLRGYPRAGDSSSGPVLVNGIETIDVTAANASVIGHSYFKESQDTLHDLGLLLNDRNPAAKRPNLTEVQTSKGRYWRLEGSVQ